MNVLVMLICVAFALMCLMVNVDTKDIGGLIGTVILQPGTTQEQVEITRNFLKLMGFAWICIGILGITREDRKLRKEEILRYTNLPPRYPLLLILGLLAILAGVLGGFVFVAKVGIDSPEFREGFAYFIGMFIAGKTVANLAR